MSEKAASAARGAWRVTLTRCASDGARCHGAGVQSSGCRASDHLSLVRCCPEMIQADATHGFSLLTEDRVVPAWAKRVRYTMIDRIRSGRPVAGPGERVGER